MLDPIIWRASHAVLSEQAVAYQGHIVQLAAILKTHLKSASVSLMVHLKSPEAVLLRRQITHYSTKTLMTKLTT